MDTDPPAGFDTSIPAELSDKIPATPSEPAPKAESPLDDEHGGPSSPRGTPSASQSSPFGDSSPAALPHSLSAERGALASVVLDNETLPEIADLTEAHFYTKRLALVLRAIRHLEGRNEIVDIITIKDELERLVLETRGDDAP